jgi:hypothetical protein
MAMPSKRKRGQAKAKQLFQRTEDLEEVIARAKLKKRTLERGKVSLYLFVAGPEGAPYTMSGFQSKMRRTKERVAMQAPGGRRRRRPTKEQLLEAVRSIDIHFHDGRARAGADAEKRGEHPARFLGHTDDGKTARRHYLNRGVTMLQPKVDGRHLRHGWRRPSCLCRRCAFLPESRGRLLLRRIYRDRGSLGVCPLQRDGALVAEALWFRSGGPVSDDIRKFLDRAELAGVTFAIENVMPQTPGKHFSAIIVSADKLLAYVADPTGFLARHFGATREQYIAWCQAEYSVRCCATTRQGRQCKNLAYWDLDLQEWLKRQGSYCAVHASV